MHIAAFLPLAVLPFAFAKTYDVQVGQDKDGKAALAFTPPTLNPAANDIIVFTFHSSQHSVAQSTFDQPCVYEKGGIYSGFPGNGKTFTVTVNDTKPVWIFCSNPGHCQGGQSMVLNPPQDKTLNEYQAAAQKSQPTESNNQPPVSGGVVGDASSGSTSASASSAASSASTAKSTSGSTPTTGKATTSPTKSSPASTSKAAAGRFTAGAGLGAMGLLGFLAGGMI